MSIGLIFILIFFGLISGMLAGLLGVGGGIFMVPFLVLAAGFGQQEAQATSLLVVLPTALVASWALHRSGVLDVGLAMRIGLSGVLGSATGAAIALNLPGEVLRVFFAILLTTVGIKLLRDAWQHDSGAGDNSGAGAGPVASRPPVG